MKNAKFNQSLDNLFLLSFQLKKLMAEIEERAEMLKTENQKAA